MAWTIKSYNVLMYFQKQKNFLQPDQKNDQKMIQKSTQFFCLLSRVIRVLFFRQIVQVSQSEFSMHGILSVFFFLEVFIYSKYSVFDSQVCYLSLLLCLMGLLDRIAAAAIVVVVVVFIIVEMFS
eukprot:TRINITY_DN5999_c0_g2_i3.p3 TRINITY_DN5999_c0_g2~~TRINITY_DN5999_c0_g2_i3.p3  ORF type:complete len:125 (-),score=0.39 TRINITY_DN5999_c0_g2_i3:411-785(-)